MEQKKSVRQKNPLVLCVCFVVVEFEWSIVEAMI
jgi:hypothetical protein